MGGKGIASSLFAMPLLSCFVLKGPPVPEISQVGAEGVVPPPPPPSKMCSVPFCWGDWETRLVVRELL